MVPSLRTLESCKITKKLVVPLKYAGVILQTVAASFLFISHSSLEKNKDCRLSLLIMLGCRKYLKSEDDSMKVLFHNS